MTSLCTVYTYDVYISIVANIIHNPAKEGSLRRITFWIMYLTAREVQLVYCWFAIYVQCLCNHNKYWRQFLCCFMWFVQVANLKLFCHVCKSKQQQFHGEGHIKPRAVWARRRFSQKTKKWICFVYREKQKSKQNKFVRSFVF